MYLASKGIIPPKIFHHDPEMRDKYDCTVAMLLAANGMIPPQEWTHSSQL